LDVLPLGEISASQAEAWRRAIEVFDEDEGRSRSFALFSEDRCEASEGDDAIRLRLSEMRLCRPRQFDACGLAGVHWRELELDRFWAERLPKSRRGARGDHALQVLVAGRLINRMNLALPALPPPKIAALALPAPPAL
jgi:hypothetical protein